MEEKITDGVLVAKAISQIRFAQNNLRNLFQKHRRIENIVHILDSVVDYLVATQQDIKKFETKDVNDWLLNRLKEMNDEESYHYVSRLVRASDPKLILELYDLDILEEKQEENDA